MTTNNNQIPVKPPAKIPAKTEDLSLESLPNIGKTLAELLHQAGIETPARLIELGSEEAFRRIKLQDDSACLSKYYALEGAVQGIRWHALSAADKQRIKQNFKTGTRKAAGPNK